jgi:hypothetical protein
VVFISTQDKFEKLLRKRPTPKDILYEDFKSFLEANGYYTKKKSGGSHRQFIYDKDGIKEITGCAEPHGNQKHVNPCYILEALNSLDRVREKQKKSGR